MAKEAPKPNGAATASPAATSAPEPAKTRTRLSFSKEKKLAYITAGLVAILTSKAVAAVLTEDQKAKVTKAKIQVDEVGGGDPFKPINERIKAIQVELGEAQKLMATDLERANEQAKELTSELDRQIKRKKQIEEMIGG